MENKQLITFDEVRDLLEDISNKEFRSKPMGFDTREVDEYLDTINDSLQRVLEYMLAVQEEREQREAARPEPAAAPQPAPAPAAAPSPAIGEIEEVLTAAVKLKNSIIAEAQEKADTMLADAEARTRAQLGSLTEEKDRLEAQIAQLKETAANYRAGFERLLQAQQSLLDAADDLY